MVKLHSNGVWVPADRVLVMDMRILMDCDLSTLTWNSMNDLWANTEAIIAGNCYCSPGHSNPASCPQLAPAGVVRAKLETIRDGKLKMLEELSRTKD